MKTPTVPLSLEEFPQQRLYSVQELPARPNPFEFSLLHYLERHSYTRIPQKPTKKSVYLCQVEWAWGPYHDRIDAYYLHKGRTHWLMWVGDLNDEEWGNWHWRYLNAIAVPIKDVSEEQAAVYLLMEYWKSQVAEMDVDHYHLIDEQGFLSVPQIQAIGREVWPDQET